MDKDAHKLYGHHAKSSRDAGDESGGDVIEFVDSLLVLLSLWLLFSFFCCSFILMNDEEDKISSFVSLLVVADIADLVTILESLCDSIDLLC